MSALWKLRSLEGRMRRADHYDRMVILATPSHPPIGEKTEFRHYWPKSELKIRKHNPDAESVSIIMSTDDWQIERSMALVHDHITHEK
jgi:hypothetical protein